MKVKGGQLIIEIEDIIQDADVVKACAKYAVFNKTLVFGIVELLLKDKIKWPGDKEDLPWYVISGFGRSYSAETRDLLISHAEKITQKANELLKKERDKYEKKYNESRRECNQLKNQLEKRGGN